MNAFKDVLRSDIHAVFLNPDEFGEPVELAGHSPVPAVVSPLEVEAPEAGDGRPGVSFEGVAVHVAASDVPDELLTGKKTTFQGEEWFVLSAKLAGGLRKISLYRERA